MTRTFRSDDGFTLIEMVVVCGIIAAALGMLMSGLASHERRSSAYATDQIIRAVHEACMRGARDEGSTQVVRGFTIDYETAPGDIIPGAQSAAGIRPWILSGPAASATLADQDTIDLAGAIGRDELWSGDTLGFIDRQRPAGEVRIGGTALPISGRQRLHVAYEPRTGFVHAVLTPTDADPPAALFACDVISAAASLPSTVSILLRSRNNGGATLLVSIAATGGLDVAAP